MTDLPHTTPPADEDDRSAERMARAISAAMWRQSTGDALVGRLRLLAEDLTLARAALVVVAPIDREVLAPAAHHVSDALSAVESAVHLLDVWQQGDRP